MFKRGQEPARLDGTVLDRTNGGQAITELPLLTYRPTISTPAQITSVPTGAVYGTADGSGPNVDTVPNDGAVTYPDFGAFGNTSGGYNPYGYNPYSYGNPYGYMNPYASPYGYALPNGTYAAPGSVYTPGQGVAPAVPGVNAPTGIVSPGTSVTTVPNTGTTIFP